jgi:hypothetical protein
MTTRCESIGDMIVDEAERCARSQKIERILMYFVCSAAGYFLGVCIRALQG